ncbi:probable phosphatase phospho1 isoform X1 [Notothenia coriiceps]|uniref:Probable phosphatase phospho1 isoform X1 n=1 Tax=Notothenia coriiceps TaxID=8208 RepID=A0A6I9NGY6_9TELE|nr:PREDICTED: probable phosphatase phospho1 isoform X1 [Notothenia coriiceps]
MGGLVGAVTSTAAAVCLSVTYKRAYHRPTGGTLPHSESGSDQTGPTPGIIGTPLLTQHNGIRNQEFSRNPGLTLKTVEGEGDPPGSRSRRSEITMASNSANISSDKRFLIFFDFDETIVDETSDDMVVQAAPGQHLPDWLKDTYQPGRYNEYMQRVLAYLAEQGVTESDIRSIMEKIPASPGMLTLLQFLRTRPPQDFEVVLLSDANSFFIESWLRRAGARQIFHRVFSNPATFNKDGRLVMRPFHSHDCARCPNNMCKQVVVRDYVARRTQERGRPYQRIFYVGDGANDFCPALALGPRDVAFPRRDFPMHRLITETHEAMPGEFKAVTVPWASGEEVVQRLRRLVAE